MKLGLHLRIEKVLNQKLTNTQFKAIYKDWNAFSKDPEKYQNSIVIDMIKQYINEKK